MQKPTGDLLTRWLLTFMRQMEGRKYYGTKESFEIFTNKVTKF
jgi:hypothetical protein